jgi:hypothetical protein
MCILRFHARAGYLQTYETLLKEIQSHPGSGSVEPEAESADQYAVECIPLADSNFNVPCESGISYPSLMAMMHQRDLCWRKAVMYIYILAYTFINQVHQSIYVHIPSISCPEHVICSVNSSGCVHLDINLLKPSRIEFRQEPGPQLTLPDQQAASVNWLEYVQEGSPCPALAANQAG